MKFLCEHLSINGTELEELEQLEELEELEELEKLTHISQISDIVPASGWERSIKCYLPCLSMLPATKLPSL